MNAHESRSGAPGSRHSSPVRHRTARDRFLMGVLFGGEVFVAILTVAAKVDNRAALWRGIPIAARRLSSGKFTAARFTWSSHRPANGSPWSRIQ